MSVGSNTMVEIHQPPVDGRPVSGGHAAASIGQIEGRKKVVVASEDGAVTYKEVHGTTQVEGPAVEVRTYTGKILVCSANQPVLQIDPARMILHRDRPVREGSWLAVVRVIGGKVVLKMDIVSKISPSDDPLWTIDHDGWAMMLKNRLLI